MIKTGKKALKVRCYWVHGVQGWKLTDYKGAVYQEGARFWLRTPTGYTEVFEKDFL